MKKVKTLTVNIPGKSKEMIDEISKVLNIDRRGTIVGMAISCYYNGEFKKIKKVLSISEKDGEKNK